MGIYKMKYLTLKLFLLIALMNVNAQYEQIPYANIENICKTCDCTVTNQTKILNCHKRNLKHILARWPETFGSNHTGLEIHATFSRNDIEILQQLPETNGILYFSARRCKIQKLQSKLFIDSPNIFRLDLSWNQIRQDALTPDIFQGPYKEQSYEPIKLKELDLSHNFISDLDSKLFEHINELTLLNLANNQFDTIDNGAAEAIASLKSLKTLDLSFNKITTLSDNIFSTGSLSNLDLQGNNFITIPTAIKKIKETLQSFDISYNPIEIIHTEELQDLTKLKFLNISDMGSLKKIELMTFSKMKNLEELHCKNNFYLTSIHLPMESKLLRLLDISNGNLNTVFLDIDSNTSNQTEKIKSFYIWPKLKSVNFAENPWNCDCMLAKICQDFKNITFEKDELTRCSSPIDITGNKLSTLNADNICKVNNHKQKMVVNVKDTSPYYIKPKHILYTLLTIGLVILSGLIVGFGLSYCRRRLKSDVIRLKSSPIRYISVRNSA